MAGSNIVKFKAFIEVEVEAEVFGQGGAGASYAELDRAWLTEVKGPNGEDLSAALGTSEALQARALEELSNSLMKLRIGRIKRARRASR
jgi:hypothetical protein